MDGALAVSSPRAILFVDDDRDIQTALSVLLRRNGMTALPASCPEEALAVLQAVPVDAVLLDLNFRRGATGGEEGLACLADILAVRPHLPVIVVTGHSGLAIAVAAMRAGAVNFLMKPWRNDKLLEALGEVLKPRGGAGEPAQPPEDVPILGGSAAMRTATETLKRAAPTRAAMLFLGEAGTGKTLFAETAIRLAGVPVGVPERLDAALLAERPPAAGGALTNGLAQGATLLIDLVDLLPAALQGALSTGLASRPDLRVFATSRLPRAALQDGALRPDLFYRLNTVEICLPPLRARGEDIGLLARHYLRCSAMRYGRTAMAFSESARQALDAYDWPGNVRELRQVMERAVVLAQNNVVQAADIPARPHAGGAFADDLNLARSERAMIEAALRRTGFNVTKAAKELGLTRASVYRRMTRHRM